jgi:hypothetical protein
LHCVLLGGVGRARYLEEGRLQEAMVHVEELPRVQSAAFADGSRQRLNLALAYRVDGPRISGLRPSTRSEPSWRGVAHCHVADDAPLINASIPDALLNQRHGVLPANHAAGEQIVGACLLAHGVEIDDPAAVARKDHRTAFPKQGLEPDLESRWGLQGRTGCHRPSPEVGNLCTSVLKPDHRSIRHQWCMGAEGLRIPLIAERTAGTRRSVVKNFTL